jgi:lipopolysaccharide/colanic/teichoic acid biosynthesis glycosyltransferase
MPARRSPPFGCPSNPDVEVTKPSTTEHGVANAPDRAPRALPKTARDHHVRGIPVRDGPSVDTLLRRPRTARSVRLFPPPRKEPLSKSERVNRALNIVLAALGLVLLSPVLLLIAVAVKATSRGPILYTQVRVGVDQREHGDRRRQAERRLGRDRRRSLDRRGRIERRGTLNRRALAALAMYERRREDIGGNPFRMYKFRTMCEGAECGSGAVWATRHDSRVTPIGGFMRQFRLDELPQLINVLKGEMNIVGPRPERPSIFSRLRTEIPDYPLRQRTRPGITGWAQIKHSYDTCVDDVRKKIGYDLEYLQRRTAWEDLKIMAKTVPTMLFRRGGW